MSTVTQTVLVCDFCGERSTPERNAGMARAVSLDNGWARVVVSALDRWGRPSTRTEAMCPECYARLTGRTADKLLREVGE